MHYLYNSNKKTILLKPLIHLLLTTGIISISFLYLALLSYVSNLGQELRLTKKLTCRLENISVWVKPLGAIEKNSVLHLLAPSASALKYINNHKKIKSAIVLAVAEQNHVH